MNINAAPISLLYRPQSSLRPIGVNTFDQSKASASISSQAPSSEILSSQHATSRQNSGQRHPVEKPNSIEKQNLNSQKKEVVEAIELRPLVVEQKPNPAIKAFQGVADPEDDFHIIDVYA